jgi:hypothetical protein
MSKRGQLVNLCLDIRSVIKGIASRIGRVQSGIFLHSPCGCSDQRQIQKDQSPSQRITDRTSLNEHNWELRSLYPYSPPYFRIVPYLFFSPSLNQGASDLPVRHLPSE